MTQPFVGQIQAFTFNWPPKNWVQCDGQLLAIQQNQALFALLGTYYGGNGVTTFALPDLRGRVPVHWGSLAGAVYTIGEPGGTETVQLTIGQLPQHTHMLTGANVPATASQASAGAALANAAIGSGTPDNYYGPLTTPQPLNAGSVSFFGSGQPHDNMQPYLAINWCICQYGIFPSRN
ncbi:MAG: tail fiber protein [Rhizomicrobium sp.]